PIAQNLYSLAGETAFKSSFISQFSIIYRFDHVARFQTGAFRGAGLFDRINLPTLSREFSVNANQGKDFAGRDLSVSVEILRFRRGFAVRVDTSWKNNRIRITCRIHRTIA